MLGANAPRGPAKPSRPGHRDAIVRVPCAQSEGSRDVALADHLEHLTWGLDIHIRPAS
jgi:hypothetical protein